MKSPLTEAVTLFLKSDAMKKETWKTIIQVIVSILTAALTALGTTSCMSHSPIAFFG